MAPDGRSLAVVDYVKDESGSRYLWVVQVARSNALFNVVSGHGSRTLWASVPVAVFIAPAGSRSRSYRLSGMTGQDWPLLVLGPDGDASLRCDGVVGTDYQTRDPDVLAGVDPFALVDDLMRPDPASVREVARWIRSRQDGELARRRGLPTDAGLRLSLLRDNPEVRAAAASLVEAGGPGLYPESTELAEAMR
jgi:hypothetical protein